jgi:archaellum component FlaF (FlaF/FlaG flagellin family)
MFSRRRRGVSTILGTIIFIGIMFTSVIPMMLVMKQADTMYTQKVHEMEARDDERSGEIITINAYPVNNNSDQLKVEVENIGVVSVKIIRVWINDQSYSENAVIKTGDTSDIGPYAVTLENDTSYSIKVITERGNSFASACGVLYYTDGYWFTPSIGIHVLVLNWFGKYQIRVYNGSWTSPDPYTTQGVDIGDINWTEVNMTKDGPYWVEVKKKVGGSFQDVPSTPVPVYITWPGGSPVINVIVDARDF